MSRIPSYPVQIFQSDEDEGYIVIVPDLPGCSAFGETQAEALRESEDAIAVWIGAAREAGNKIPAPSQLPLYKKYSGKFCCVCLRIFMDNFAMRQNERA